MNVERIIMMVVRRFLRQGVTKVMRQQGVKPSPEAKNASRMLKLGRRIGRM